MFDDYRPNRFGPGRSAVICARGAVATSQPLAAQVGVEILRAGGNAIDAAVAVSAALTVTEPAATHLGGDAFALVYRARDKKLLGLNASGRAAHAAKLEFFTEQGLRSIPLRHSMYAVTVPGLVDSWSALLTECGTMDLADVLQPAIELAEHGYPVSPQWGVGWGDYVELLSACPDTQRTLLIDGRAPRVGELLRQPNLARTLRLIAEGGRDAFYRGEIAEKIVKFSDENGGLFTLEDFADHTSEWVEPISTSYRGYEVFEIPPNGQGIAALLALNIVEGFDLASMSHNSVEYLHCLTEAMKLSIADLHRYITDSDFAQIPVEGLLSQEYTDAQRARIDPETANPLTTAGVPPTGTDTAYLCVVDADRNVVSYINSIFTPFGSGLVAGDTGVLLQNRGAGFSLDPNHVNCIAPHKRTLHTIIPGMIMLGGAPLLTFGVMGGPMQPQGHLQLICNLVDFNMDVQTALEAPRFCVLEGPSISLERGVPRGAKTKLRAKKHRIVAPDGVFFGGGQAILIHPDYNTLIAGSDPRRDGCAAGY